MRRPRDLLWRVFLGVLGGTAGYFLSGMLLSGGPPPATVVEDTATGCNYLVGQRGGITPRLGAHGEHIGCRPALRRSRPIHPPAPEV